MEIKTTISIVLLFTFFVDINTQCSNNCANCTSSTSCTTCNPGSFLVNNTYCAPCPPGCNLCTQGINGFPNCTGCTAPAQLGTDNRCFYCSPNCLTCSMTASNCTTCAAGFTKTAVNNSYKCVSNSPIPFCQSWSTDSQNSSYCSICNSNYFPFLNYCAPCPFQCKICTFDSSLIWTNSITYWRTAITTALNNNFTGTPVFINNGSFSDMPTDFRGAYIIAYSIATDLTTAGLLNNSTLNTSIPTWINFLASIYNQTKVQILTAIAQRINLQFNYTWNGN